MNSRRSMLQRVRLGCRHTTVVVQLFVLIGIIILCTRSNTMAVSASVVVVKDVNNMLRDVVVNAGISAETNINGKSHIGSHYDKENSNTNNNNDNDSKFVKESKSNEIETEIEKGNRVSNSAAEQQMLRSSKTNKVRHIEESDANLIDDDTSVELLRFVEDENQSEDNKVNENLNSNSVENKENDFSNNRNANSEFDTLSLNDQVRLLSKQLNALMTRRREDYDLLEHNLRKSLRITTNAATVDIDIQNELEQLRYEVKSLRDGHLNANRERLTIEWLQQSVAELRKQLVELQQLASNAARDVQHRTQSYEDLATIRNDFQQLKLELVALRERQQQSEIYVQELREEALQQEEDYKRLLLVQKRVETTQSLGAQTTNAVDDSQQRVEEGAQQQQQQMLMQDAEFNTDISADHKRRHCRFQRQQIYELQLGQRSLKRQLEEQKYRHIDERVHSIEIEQHRIAEANFNLSRQIASLDKLHSSMLELLEDVEGLQNKMDKNIPELRHEISKLEFSNAQLNSEQNLVREEGKNVARSVQAMAVSVSTLQDERDGIKTMQSTVSQLRTNVDRLQSMMDDVQRALKHHRPTSSETSSSKLDHHHHNHHHNKTLKDVNDINAAAIVTKLENVEQEYESIIGNLPHDCSEGPPKPDGIYMIAPQSERRPFIVHCDADGWTTVQRRYDGSADFNRSWDDYAQGFGTPAGEYWIGNEQLHHLTRNNCTRLRVTMQDIYDNAWVAEYDNFYISSRADGYRLHISGYAGNASDALDYQQGMQFSAIDVDRDISQTHCAANYEGGWWFSHCQHANLNGRYNLGLTWFDASRNEWIAVKSSEMLVKPNSELCAAMTMANSESDSESDSASLTPKTTIQSSKLNALSSTSTTTLTPSTVSAA